MPLHVGATRKNIRFPPGALPLPSTGYGPGSKDLAVASVTNSLRARALYVHDAAADVRLVFLLLDLHSGTPAVSEAVLQRLEPAYPWLGQALHVTGTHAHSGPGRIYGSTFYDTVAGGLFLGNLAVQKPDQIVVSAVADAAAEAIEQAIQTAGPATLAWHAGVAPGVAAQRSGPAFPYTSAAWCAENMPGAHYANEKRKRRWATDPRLPVLAARNDAGELVAALAVFACHNTALGQPTVM